MCLARAEGSAVAAETVPESFLQSYETNTYCHRGHLTDLPKAKKRRQGSNGEPSQDESEVARRSAKGKAAHNEEGLEVAPASTGRSKRVAVPSEKAANNPE